MQTNFLRRLIFDEKSRSLLIQTLVIGLFALFIYLIAQQTAYKLEKRGISSGFDFHNIVAGYGAQLGLSDDWAANILTQVGNYSESFEKHIGPNTPINTQRGLNALYSDGGILYAPPFR